MTQESEQAQEAWKLRADDFSAMHSGDYLLGQAEFKAAIKAEIERELLAVNLNIIDDPKEAWFDGARNKLERVLSLLDTVKPLNR